MSFISEPEVTLQIIPASQLASVRDQKVLIVGQKLAGGTATAGALIQDHPNDGSEDTLFGQRSHLAGMVRQFKLLNKRTQMDIIPLADDGGATQGTGVITVTGTATEDATITISVGSEKNHKVEIDVLTGDAATDVGDDIVTAFTADADAPFTAANALGVVTFTAENGGTLANEWSIKISGSVAGLAFAITAWSGGATDPSLTNIFDPIANIRYQTVVWPSVYDLTVAETELDARFNVTNEVKDGIAFQVKKGTLASLKSYASTFNSQSLCVIGNKTVAESDRDGTATFEMPDVICAQICAIRSLRLTQDAPLSQFLTTVARSDQFGGPEIGSLPYFNTSLPNLPVAQADDFFTAIELDELRDNAVSAFGPNRAFNGTIFGEFVTTSLTDTAGNPDDSFKFVNTVDTASIIREFFFENYKNQYAQTRLTDGDLIAGRDIANEASIRAFSNELYDELAEQALVQAGADAKKDFDDNLIITVTVRTGTVTVDMAPLLVTQLRAILGTIQINFGD